MKLTLTFAASINAKITDGDNPDVTKWTSPEDQEYFKKTLENFDVVIRSSTTYELAKNRLDKSGKKRYVVLTRSPEKYKNEEISGIVEFTKETPAELVERLSKEGVKNALLAAGGGLASAFFKEDLINELQLTLEPKIFGKGTPMIADEDFTKSLKLKEIEKLNDNGTVLLKYEVLNNK